MKEYMGKDLSCVHVHGRISERATEGVPLFWTGACAEINMTGSMLFATFDCVTDGGEGYVRIEVDGFDLLRFTLESGRTRVRLLSGFGDGKTKNVRIYRENQTSATRIVLISLETDGELVEIPERPLIEFIGDSVTSGEGLACAPSMKNWVPAVFSCRGNYALMTAQHFDWDWSILSVSGCGVYCGWDNCTYSSLPRLYGTVAGAFPTEANNLYGAGDEYSFPRHPVVTVVNLGANDANAMDPTRPTWTDENGVAHKLSMFDGKADAQSAVLVKNAYKHMMRIIREKHPDTSVIMAYNMFGDRNGINGILLSAVREYKRETGDNNVFTVKLPQNETALLGSRSHPGPQMHKKFANALIKAITAHGIA